jgi:hypothetical protein
MTWSGWKIVMAGPSPRCGLFLCVALAAACASAPPPQKAKRTEPPKTPAKATASPEKAPEKAVQPPVELASPSRTEEITTQDKPKEVDVVDPGGDRAPRTLVEAARAEKERRAKSGPPVAVITDKNIAQHQGKITVAEPRKTTAQPVDTAALEMLKNEEYWRNRAVDIRTRLRKAADTVEELEVSAAGWRRRFYAEEDPSRRDSKIKPEWDRVLAELEENRQEIETTRQELEEFLDEGRRAGALPGWLREGAELEPEMEKPDDSNTVDPSEPQIYEQKPPAREEVA